MLDTRFRIDFILNLQKAVLHFYAIDFETDQESSTIQLFMEMTKATHERLMKEMQNWRNIRSRSDHLKKLRVETTLLFEALEFGMETRSSGVL